MALRQHIYRRHSLKLEIYRHLVAQYISANLMQNEHQMFDHKGKKKSMDFLLNENKETWGPSLSNKLGRLSQVVRDITWNNTLTFIDKQEVPRNKK